MKPIDQCIRCGTCCKKGGPALHLQDLPLIQNGAIPLIRLSTIRRGEPAFDNIKNRLAVTLSDIVKIKPQIGQAACFFYEDKNFQCRIYRSRPIECRTLKCWDTRDMAGLYEQNRITRSELIGNITGLWDLVADHHARCDFEPVLTFVNTLKSSGKTDREMEEKTVYILQYDLEIRKLVIEKGNVDPEMIEFLFGRPMVDVLCALGMNMHRQNGKIIFSTGIPSFVQPV